MQVFSFDIKTVYVPNDLTSSKRFLNFVLLPKNKEYIITRGSNLEHFFSEARRAARTDFQIQYYVKPEELDNEYLEGELYCSLHIPSTGKNDFRLVTFFREDPNSNDNWIVPYAFVANYLQGIIDASKRLKIMHLIKEKWDKFKNIRLELEKKKKSGVCFETIAQAKAQGIRFDREYYVLTKEGYKDRTCYTSKTWNKLSEDSGEYILEFYPELAELVFRAKKKTGFEYEIHEPKEGALDNKQFCILDYYDELEEKTKEIDVNPSSCSRSSESLEYCAAYLQGVVEF